LSWGRRSKCRGNALPGKWEEEGGKAGSGKLKVALGGSTAVPGRKLLLPIAVYTGTHFRVGKQPTYTMGRWITL
jgi:hypothetical protein